MKKRLFAVLLAVLMIASLSTVAALADDATALSAADANGVITLTQNVTVSAITLNEDDTTIDLNGHTLTYTGTTSIAASEGQTLTVTDNSGTGEGEIISTNIVNASSFLAAYEGGTVNAYNVTVRTSDTGTAFFARGNAAAVNVINCDVYGGAYCVGTNSGTVDNYGVTITLRDSSFDCARTDKAESCTIMINVGGTLNIDNCDIVGERQAVLVRAGTANISNSRITMEEGTTLSADKESWGSGNDVPMGALVVGSQTSNSSAAYMADANCVVTNTTISAIDDVPAVYVSSNNESSNSYVANVNISGSGTVITGDVVLADGKADAPASVTFENGAQINGNLTNNSAASSAAIVNGANITGVTTDNSTNGTIYNENAKDSDSVALNVNSAKAYDSLAEAISEADDGDTITLVGDVTEDSFAETITNKALTIDGNGNTISITVALTTDGTIAFDLNSSDLTLTDLTMTIHGSTVGGTGFDVKNNGSSLTINNATVTMDNTKRGIVFSEKVTTIGEVNVINGSELNFNGLSANASNGGAWTISNSEVNYTNLGPSACAMSVESAVVSDSTITVNGAGLFGVYGSDITLNDGAVINVNNAGYNVPYENWNQTETYMYPVEIKNAGDASLTINEGAVLNVTNCVNKSDEENNNIYVPAGTTFTNNGVVNADVVMADAPAGQHTVEVIDNGMTIAAEYVADNGSFTLPDTPTRSGYTFRGWLCGGKLYDSGDQVTVNSDMTFTAVWDAINIPDTYPIDLVVGDGGDAKLNFTNASEGTVITVTVTPDEGYRLDYITVDGERISGTSFKMPDHSVTVHVYFTDGTVAFADVSRTDWFYNYVQYVVSNGLMEGTSATTFEPNANMSRAMVWTILARIDGETVTGANWITTARAWAMANGVSDGENANGAVTREQLATMLWRYAGEPVSSYSLGGFTDATSVSDYAATAMAWAVESGIITGMTDTTLAPQGTATRAQCAAMLMRFVEL